MSQNLKYMLKEAAIPTLLTALFFTLLSINNPASAFSDEILSNVKSAFNINLWLVIPALFILVLPVLRVSVKKAMGASIAAAFLVSVFVQK